MWKSVMHKTKYKIFITIITFALFFGAFGFSYAQYIQQKKIENELLKEADFLMVHLFHDIFTLQQHEIVSVHANLKSSIPYTHLELTTGEKVGFIGEHIVSTFGKIHLENTQIELLPSYTISEIPSTNDTVLYEISFTLRHKKTNVTSTFNNKIPIIAPLTSMTNQRDSIYAISPISQISIKLTTYTRVTTNQRSVCTLARNNNGKNNNELNEFLQVNENNAGKLAVIAGIVTTLGDALATMATVLALEEAQAPSGNGNGNNGVSMD